MLVSAEGSSLSIECQREDKPASRQGFLIDFDRSSVHYGSGAVTHTVVARISELQIRLRWTVIEYDLDRSAAFWWKAAAAFRRGGVAGRSTNA
jgi:hypothetical protein